MCSKSYSSLMIIGLVFALSALIKVNCLSPTFYSSSCPNLFTIVKNKVHQVVLGEPRMCASLLRLHFHDCFVQGCDGSILLNDTSLEQTAAPNFNSVRGYNVVNDIKAAVEAQCPGKVSCADLLALIARDCVVELLGPTWEVLFGRKDSFTGNKTAANMDLPPFFFNVTELIAAYERKNLSVTDLVALSGAHTIGQAQCSSFKNRLYGPFQSGDCMQPSYNTSLQGSCPSTGGDTNLSPLDVQTPIRFDNKYYNNLLQCKGLLFSDQTLATGWNFTTFNLVHTYAMDQNQFFNDFAAAMIKMGNLGPASTGEIRLKCWKRN